MKRALPPNLARRPWAAVTASASVLALGVAYLAQGLGLRPCALCRFERWPYWGALGLALLGMLPATRAECRGRWLRRATLLLLALGVGLAGLHVGIEGGWISDPVPACRADAGPGADGLAALPATPQAPCGEPVYPMPGLKLSFAELNLFYASAVLGAAAYAAALRPRRHPRGRTPDDAPPR